jgi:hypothetical protein
MSSVPVVKPEPNITDEEFITQIENTNTLTESSKEIYLRRIRQLQKDIDPTTSIIYKILNPEYTKDKIFDYAEHTKGRNNGAYDNSTMSQYATVLVSFIIHHNEIQEYDPTLINEWRHIRKFIADPYNRRDDNEPNPKQLLGYISFDNVCEIRDSLQPGSQEHLLLSMYTYIPPVRADYWQTRIYKFPTEANTYVTPKENYIILTTEPDDPDNVIVLQTYKTVKHYGGVKIKIPPKLHKIIQLSLTERPREYLFTKKNKTPYMRANTWTVWADKTLKRVTNNKFFTLTMFRHIYLSRKDLKLPSRTRNERKELSTVMGHSLDMQDQYIWKRRTTIEI